MKTSWVVIAVLAVGATFSAMSSSDAELTDRIVGYLRPRCGGNHIRDEREPELIEVLDIQGDTNRLARLLAELAHTNDNWNASMALWQLEKYGTSEQLPCLYSLATNPVVGVRAVKAILHIEGVTSNSLSAVQSYISVTNGFPLMNSDTRSNLCRDVVKTVFADNALSPHRTAIFDIACGFARDVNVLPKGLDKTLIDVEPGYRFSKRRLAILRSAQTRLNEKFQAMDTNDAHFESESHVYEVQTNFLMSAINELVAYPEADLPD